MKRNYFFLLAIVLLGASVNAQTVVNVAPGEGTIEAAIAAAGTEAGNSVFTLQRGGIYTLTNSIDHEFALTIVAAEGDGDRPVIKPNSDAKRLFRPYGDLTLKGLFISGTNDEGAGQNNTIRSYTDNTITFDDCHFDNCVQNTLRIDGKSTVIITNCIFSNQSSGNAINPNTEHLISLTIQNTTFYNYSSSVLNYQGGVIEYIEIDHCTMFNIGANVLSLNQAITAIVTNNQFINGGILGSSNSTTSVYAVSLDTLTFPGNEAYTQALTFTNNNFFIDPAYVDALPDTINAVEGWNALAGSFADIGSFLNEDIAFMTPPAPYSFETGWDLTARGDFYYDESHDSYTGGTDGTRIGDTNWVYIPITGVDIVEDSTIVAIGGVGDISVVFIPENTSEPEIVWESGDDAIVTVEDGILSGLQDGAAYVYAVSVAKNSIMDSCWVTVMEIPVTGVELDQDTITITNPGTGTLVATIVPANAGILTYAWSSGNEAVATVADGVVTGVMVGETYVVVTTTDGGFTDTCTVIVTPTFVTGVSLDEHTLTLAITETGTLVATVAPSDATDKTITWSTENAAIATVVDGTVTGIAGGEAYIYVTTTDGSFMDSCLVTVSTVGINDLNTTGFQVYPNPLSEGVLHIKLKDNRATSLEIYNALGVLIHKELVNNRTLIELSAPEEKGIYFVKIINQNNNSVERFIVQ